MNKLIVWLIPESLPSMTLFGIELWQYVGVLIAAILGILLSVFVTNSITTIIQKLILKIIPTAKKVVKHKNELKYPLNFIFIGWISLLIISSLGFSMIAFTEFIIISKIISYIGFIWLAWRCSDVIVAVLQEKAKTTVTKFDDLFVPLVTRTLKVIIVLFGFVSIAEILNLPLSSILAGLGIGGIAVAMAAKETIANIFGSLTVLVDRPFSIGDWVKINDIEGTVEDLGFRSTKVRTFYNSLISVPNSILLTASIDNLGVRSYRRISIKLGILYNTPAEKVETFCQGIRQLIQDHPDTTSEFHVYFNNFNESSLDIMVYFFMTVPDWGTELSNRHDIFISFLKLAESQGISFAFPTRTIQIETSPKVQ